MSTVKAIGSLLAAAVCAGCPMNAADLGHAPARADAGLSRASTDAACIEKLGPGQHRARRGAA